MTRKADGSERGDINHGKGEEKKEMRRNERTGKEKEENGRQGGKGERQTVTQTSYCRHQKGHNIHWHAVRRCVSKQ